MAKIVIDRYDTLEIRLLKARVLYDIILPDSYTVWYIPHDAMVHTL